uniref:CBM20 domain-containing protein n=1 Tax=Chromera velia CCMP2878 TaxID=1169474 RepID=A0A0G4F8L0_9ALVE|eukprot:Cvel_15791.t1-p1 / transcript=Cvel_15791.t1 / gene=Cvel_15791 / organism=Chromera_velia_CCMP2878 / gene_product=Zinc finger protein 283, putative / transcript_product=Zinc finger protein 283, putative / location=Cvel_scaffold1185:24578-27779(-) / protein_length=690 / sequence_SO=supercontig / SO=protein_coding / is_pseudo=false
MKGFIAFIAHCPEVRENQRVVVVGECPELGGWELGGALSLAPAPCGRPWWVSSEVEVNLLESPMGVSGDFVNGVGAGGEGGGMGVSELKFRLLAIPNDGEEVKVSDPGNLMCLEPLRGGDFRIVRLVSAPPLSDRSSVGKRGVNTIHVGAERGGEQQAEMVGISVEWGVPESVQLALLPQPTNRQTENPRREYEHDDLSARPSQIACPHSSEGRTQTNSRIVKPIDYSDSHDTSNIQSAVSRATSSEQKVLQRPPLPSTKVEKEERRHADGSTFGVKRRRSGSDLAQVEADECDEVSGCPGERRGGGLWGKGREGRGTGCMGGEKQRRLTVSLSDSALLSSEMCRGRGGPIAGWKVVVSENDRARIVVGRASVSTVAGALNAKSVEEKASVNTVAGALNAKSVEEKASVNTVAGALNAKSAEGRACVSTVGSALSAKSAEGRAYVSTVGSALSARSAEGGAFVSTADGAVSARSVGGRVFVSTAGSALSATNVAGRGFVSTAGSDISVRIVEGRAYASMADSAVDARTAEGRVFVSTVAFAVSARSAEGGAFVSTADGAVSARSVGGRVFVSTAGSALSATNVVGRVFVSTAGSDISVRIVEGRAYASMADSAVDARSVEGKASASTVAGTLSARSAEGRVFVSTVGSATTARTAEGGASVFIEESVDALGVFPLHSCSRMFPLFLFRSS